MTNEIDVKAEKLRLRKVVKRINEGVKTAETYSSGFANEKVIVSVFKIMSVEQLEQLRYLLNQIIKKKKIQRRINDTSSNR